jgi:hypothetical protein
MLVKSRFIFFATFCFFVCSCSRRGCTDKTAENYEPRAKVDCSCYYVGKAYLWYQDASRLGATTLFYYIDGEFTGKSTKGLEYYEWYSEPTLYEKFGNYDANDGNILIVNLEQAKSKICSVVIKNEAGNIVWQREVQFNAGKIFQLQL